MYIQISQLQSCLNLITTVNVIEITQNISTAQGRAVTIGGSTKTVAILNTQKHLFWWITKTYLLM